MVDSFYDVKGNEVSKDNIVAEFINNYTGNLTDFNEGSEIRNLIEAFAVYAMSLEERLNDNVYIMDVLNADGEYLDLLAGQPGIDMERIPGAEATGRVLFTVRNQLLEELSIPAGTIVTSDTGLDFETETDNIIPAGELSRECMVRAIDVGVDGNIPAYSIITKEDGYDAVDGFTVSNPEAFKGGLDFEEDNSFRDRIIAKMSMAKFGSKPYYISMIHSEFPEAHDIFFDTSSVSYDAVVTPNTYSGVDAQTSLTMEVMAFLANDNNVLLGHTFNVVSPVVKTVDVYFGDADEANGLYVKLANYDTDTVARAKAIIDAYLMGGAGSYGHDFRGLNLYEEFSTFDLQGYLSKYLDDLFVSLTEVGDCHSFTSENKYGWSYE